MRVVAVLGILFITLKLTGVIAWSWGLVLLPLYFPLVMVVVSFIGILSLLIMEK